MLIRKILEHLWGAREPLSLEQAQVALEQARGEFEAAHRALREEQRAGGDVTEAARRAHALRQRQRQAEAEFIQAGGTLEGVELTELVRRKVRQWFPPDEQAEAIRLLETECGRNLPFSGACDAQEPEDVRLLEDVRLAVVKLSGGNLAELRRQVEEAKKDIRDVVYFAHAPEAVKRGLFIRPEADAEMDEIMERDRRQYEEWLRGDGPPDQPAA